MTPKEWYALYLMQFGREQLLRPTTPDESEFLNRMRKDLEIPASDSGIRVLADIDEMYCPPPKWRPV